MDCINFVRKPVAVIMIMTLIFASMVMGFAPASAGMIQTSQVLQKESNELDKDRLLSMLERDEVQHKLQDMGVDPEIAEARVKALTEQEMARVSQRMETLPAGEGPVSSLVGAAVFVFLVLLVTDILGFTDVFHFVKK